MSYILEALKKAEAERRTGNAPSIHTPHSFALPDRTAAWWQRPLPWVIAVALLVAALGAWLFMRVPAAPPQPAAPVAANAVPAATAPAPAAPPVPPVATAAPAAVEPVPAPPRVASPPEKTEPDVRKAAEKPTEKPAAKKSTAKKSEEKKAEEKKAEEKPAKKTAPPQRQESAEVQDQPVAPPLRDLPEHVQREIPPLQVGGYIYSGNKADRSVLINKRLAREGDEVAPGLVLERMTPSGMVLNFRGHRYRSSY